MVSTRGDGCSAKDEPLDDDDDDDDDDFIQMSVPMLFGVTCCMSNSSKYAYCEVILDDTGIEASVCAR